MSDSLKQKTVSGVLWNAINRFSSQGIQFVFNILIARILLPEDYGVVAMLSIFLAVSQAFIDSGFANALVRKKDRTEADCNTVFYFNIVISLFFCLLLWVTAPAIAAFYKTPILSKITRIVCFNLVINAFGAVQHTKLTIDINFKTKAIISIITITAVGAVGLWMAKKGYGVWALVVQSLVSSSLNTILAWVFVRWRPRLIFSWKSLKEMFAFGSKLLASGLIDTVWGNMYNLVIGKVINPTALGVYNRAESFATFPSANIYGLVQGVSYPVLCSIQDDKERLREAFRKYIRLFAYIVFPMMVGLAVVADPFIRLILTDNWAESIPYLQILCFALMWYPLDAMNITFPNVLGHSEYYLRAVIANKIISLLVLIITVPFGLKVMCLGQVFAYTLFLFVNSFYTGRLINYNVFKQLRDILPVLAISLSMGAVVYLTARLFEKLALKLCIGIVVGVIYYWAASVVFRLEEYRFLLDLAKQKTRLWKRI